MQMDVLTYEAFIFFQVKLRYGATAVPSLVPSIHWQILH